MQLSAKTLLCPFTSTVQVVSDADAANDSAEADNLQDHDSDTPDLIDDEEDRDEDDRDEDEGNGNNEGENNDSDDEEDVFETLSDMERKQLIDDMAAVRTTLDKVCFIVIIFSLAPVLTTGFEGSKTLLCHYPLHYNCSSGLA
jgi:hypothetical protein